MDEETRRLVRRGMRGQQKRDYEVQEEVRRVRRSRKGVRGQEEGRGRRRYRLAWPK